MHYIVYLTTNLLNNTQYIGIHQTKNLDDGYLGSGKHLKRAVKKYGAENFKREILHHCSSHEEMLAKEAELVTEDFCNRADTYNICVGGFGGGFKYLNDSSIEHLERCKRGYEKSLREYVPTTEQKHKRAKRAWVTKKVRGIKPKDWTGKSHSEETKAKIGLANSQHQSGSNNSQFGTMWITNGTESRKIKKVDIIPDGWRRGR